MGPLELLATVAEFLDGNEVRYFVTGSMASMAYGETRTTMDVDVAVYLRYADARAMTERFVEPDWYLSPEGMRDAIEHCTQFNLIHVPSGLKVDFMTIEDRGYDGTRFQRARRLEYAPGRQAWFSAPEDVILKKLQWVMTS